MKYYILVFVLSFLVFFVVYFPGERMAGYIIDNIATQTGAAISSSGNDMSFFPSIGISVDSAKIKFSPASPELTLGKSFFGIPIVSLIIFSPSLKIDANVLGGNIDGKIYGIPLSSKKQVQELLVDINAHDIKLSEVMKQWMPLIDIDAKTSVKVDGALNTVNTAYSELNINADLDNIRLKETNLFGIMIPNAVIKSGKLQAAITNGELTIEKFILGGPNQPVDISIKGKMSLKLNMPYDFSVSIKLTGDMEKNLGSFLGMIPAQAKRPDGTYTFRLKGDSKMPIPQIIPM
jgi:type II secretion system protein N